MSLVRAVALKDFRNTALSTTGFGTAYSTVTPVSGQKLYAALHLTAISTGRTFVGSLQAASSSGFGTLTTELTWTISTYAGSSYQVVASPSTDLAWRRVKWLLSTTASTAGSWNGLFWVGIQ